VQPGRTLAQANSCAEVVHARSQMQSTLAAGQAMTYPMQPIGLELEQRLDGDLHTLLLSGELDIASVPALQAAVERICAGDTRGVTLDLSRLLFIDSTGLAGIVLASKLCEKRGCDFLLIPGPSAVQRLFELTGLIDVLPFHHDGSRDAEVEATR
jgi:anti-sigma B factor antagonist